jgi:hypothetical protein
MMMFIWLTKGRVSSIRQIDWPLKPALLLAASLDSMSFSIAHVFALLKRIIQIAIHKFDTAVKIPLKHSASRSFPLKFFRRIRHGFLIMRRFR